MTLVHPLIDRRLQGLDTPPATAGGGSGLHIDTVMAKYKLWLIELIDSGLSIADAGRMVQQGGACERGAAALHVPSTYWYAPGPDGGLAAVRSAGLVGIPITGSC